MTLIYNGSVDRTLDQLLATYGKESARGTRLEAWSFDDAASRRATEAKLREFGVEAKLRSAYKPLLHFFLEEADLVEVESVAIGYPVHESCPHNRFLLESYPLAALTEPAEISFEIGRNDFIYDVVMTYKEGRKVEQAIFAPNRRHTDFIGETLVSPTGWVRLNDEPQGKRLETDYEALFHTAMRMVVDHDWGNSEPYFEELSIRASLPIADQTLPIGEEIISLREALHEDLYFSLLEVFQKKSGRPLGDRGLQPGQIIPEIRLSTDSGITLKIETVPLNTTERHGELQPVTMASSPLSVSQISRELAKVGGETFKAYSRAGRVVEARYRYGSDAAIMISGGQHPNETTGIVGALRAAQELSLRPDAHFTVSPLENPDGYGVHQRLCADNPRHMHHAARYTALGDDLEYRTGTDLYEKAIRLEAERISKAQLHVNLHGYPAHEWTRPMSGYVPRGFSMWTLPKGFFLIMRYRDGWEMPAERLIDAVTQRLTAVPGLMELNDRQIRLYETHAGETGFRIINGFPCLISMDNRHAVPLTLITEYPDETIYDGAFIAGHTAQMQTVLAAYDALQTCVLPKAVALSV